MARDPEEGLRPARLAGIRSGMHDVELVLLEPQWLELTVRDAHGGRPAEFEVRQHRIYPGGREGWPRSHAGHDGALRLSLPIDPFLLEVEAPGFALARRGPFEPEQAPPGLEVELEPMPGLRGRVTFEGAPVAGARL